MASSGLAAAPSPEQEPDAEWAELRTNYHHARGMSLSRLGRFDEADTDLESVLAAWGGSEPDSEPSDVADVRLVLADGLLQRKRFEQAANVLEQGLRFTAIAANDPMRGLMHSDLAAARLGLGEPAAALTNLRSAQRVLAGQFAQLPKWIRVAFCDRFARAHRANGDEAAAAKWDAEKLR